MANSLIVKFKSFCMECWRVIKVTKKPDSYEFKTIVKASGLGMLIIGGIGFIVHLIKVMIGG